MPEKELEGSRSAEDGKRTSYCRIASQKGWFSGKGFCPAVFVERKGIMKLQVAGILGEKKSRGKAPRLENVYLCLGTVGCDARQSVRCLWVEKLERWER